jgi:hypothetical protein
VSTNADFFPSSAISRGTARERSAVRLFFVVQAVGIFFLQKLALPLGEGSLQLILPLFYAGLAMLAWRGTLNIDPIRLGLYAVLISFAVISSILAEVPFSVPGLMLLALLYLPLVTFVRIDRAEYVDLLRFYQKCMLLISCIVMIQYVTQLLFGVESWVNLDNIIPKSLQFPNFMYMRPVFWGSPDFKPNGVFLLEPSFVSQFAIIAICIELVYFRRIWMLVILGMAQILSLSGSGLLILAFAAPLFLAKLPARLVVAGAFAGLVLAAGAFAIGWFDQIILRIGEFSQPNSSAWFRYIVPLNVMAEHAQQVSSIYTGWGAGATPEGTFDLIGLTFTKLFTEYGLLTFLALYALLARTVFIGTPSIRMAWLLFVFYNIGTSGLLLPIMVLPMFLLAGFFRLNPEVSPQQAR